MYYHDPILYQFYFEVLSQKEYEQTVHHVFCELLEHCAKYAQAYTDGADASKAWIRLDMRAGQPYGNVRLDDGTFILPGFTCAYDWGRIMAEAKTSQLTGFCFEGNDRYLFRRFHKRPTPLGKLISKAFYEAIETTTQEELANILNCPDEMLDEVVVPRSLCHVYEAFRIELNRWPVEKDGRCLTIKIIPDDYPSDRIKPKYCYKVNITLPRFLITAPDEEKCLKKLWKDSLIRLGEAYPECIGSIDYDAVHDRGGRGAFSASAAPSKWAPWRSDDTEQYFSNNIPGYCWGMLLNSAHKKILDEKRTKEYADMFHEIKTLENGNIYLQLTEDMKRVDKDSAKRLRCFMKPAFPQTDIRADWWAEVPLSFRMGIEPDEIVIPSVNKIIFSIRHLPKEQCEYLKQIYEARHQKQS